MTALVFARCANGHVWTNAMGWIDDCPRCYYAAEATSRSVRWLTKWRLWWAGRGNRAT